MKAQCCAGVPTDHGGPRICGETAVWIARTPGYLRSASSFCVKHPPSDAWWIILAQNDEGFEINLDQPAGTPAYFGIAPEGDTMLSVVLSQELLDKASELGRGDPAAGVRYALAAVSIDTVRYARNLLDSARTEG